MIAGFGKLFGNPQGLARRMTKVAGFGGSELRVVGKVTGPGIVGSFKAAASIFTVAVLYQKTFRRTDSSA